MAPCQNWLLRWLSHMSEAKGSEVTADLLRGDHLEHNWYLVRRELRRAIFTLSYSTSCSLGNGPFESSPEYRDSVNMCIVSLIAGEKIPKETKNIFIQVHHRRVLFCTSTHTENKYFWYLYTRQERLCVQANVNAIITLTPRSVTKVKVNVPVIVTSWRMQHLLSAFDLSPLEGATPGNHWVILPHNSPVNAECQARRQ